MTKRRQYPLLFLCLLAAIGWPTGGATTDITESISRVLQDQNAFSRGIPLAPNAQSRPVDAPRASSTRSDERRAKADERRAKADERRARTEARRARTEEAIRERRANAERARQARQAASSPAREQVFDSDFETIKNVPLRFDSLGMTATYVEERKREGRWTHYRTRYEVELLDPDGSAATAGIRTTDSLVYFNHQTFGGQNSLESYWERVPTGGTAMLGVRPAGQEQHVSLPVVKIATPSGEPMVRLSRAPGELAALDVVRSFDRNAPGTRLVDAAEFADYLEKTLYFKNVPYNTLLEIFFGGNGVAGMKYNVGGLPEKYCGKWWIADSKVCWGVLGARSAPVCYEPMLADGQLFVFLYDDPSAPERYELIRAESGDTLGYGAGSQRAFEEFLRISAREDQRLGHYADAHHACEQHRSAAITALRPGAASPSPSSVYDSCMSDAGFPLGLFDALSLRTVLSTYELLVTGQRSLQQCTF